jgi:hypothetical protein
MEGEHLIINKSSNKIQNKKINEIEIKNKGEKIYEKNNFLSKIWDIMSYKPFYDFFETFLNDYSDVQVAIVFFNLYKTIKEKYYNNFHKQISRGEMIYMLKNIMTNNYMRKYFIDYTKEQGLLDNQYLDYNFTTKNMICDMEKDVNYLLENL